ncbi:hypothetical protein EDB81DRAFT_772976 [Dactylonectria macrodidyma]|uniref:Uncharacterized protein n=1 Tax=Dactylonectria macrodidyma TaxID=307937 RepID=A0A9P9FSY7_9HYPO|nr:hypothetical protein EDB81DRAFT_772976 [Dactylonectria macrodidyma]
MSASPSSPWSLPAMAFRGTWQEQLRRTTAISNLKNERYDLFPLQEVQDLTDDLLRTSYRSTGLLARGIEPQSKDCEQLLILEIAKLKDETFAEESGILACLHAFPPDIAYGQLVYLRQRSEVPDESFLRRVRGYLQCLIVAHKARPELFNEDPTIAVKELFEVVKDHGVREHFPPVLRLLRAVGEKSCEDFLPLKFVRQTLQYVDYKGNLEKELKELAKTRSWFSAHKLVDGLRQLGDLELPGRILQDVFPNIPLWASWTPDRGRIREWENPVLDPYRGSLALIFDLEGPDTTGNQLHTLRQSSPGIFSRQVYRLPTRNGQFILDSLLSVLDSSVLKGAEAVQLFLAVCVEPKTISWQALERVEAALELTPTSHIQALNHLKTVIGGDDLLKKMQAISSALTVIHSSVQMQKVFGNPFDIAHRGPRILSEAQQQLCRKLEDKKPSERFATNVVRLGRSLASATWLHHYWTEGYIEMLRHIPTEATISTTFLMMNTVPPDIHHAFRDAIAARVCASNPVGLSSTAAGVVAFTLTVDDPVWSIPLDRDRNSLRITLLRNILLGFNPTDAKACVKQAQKEHDTFVREMRDLVVADTDMACVNLSAYLARSMVKGGRFQPASECWRRLLLWLMRRRPEGLLERCGKALTPTPWLEWIRHLQSLYGTRHYDPEGGLGITLEKINAISARKVGVGRMTSISTYSTSSTSRTMD